MLYFCIVCVPSTAPNIVSEKISQWINTALPSLQARKEGMSVFTNTSFELFHFLDIYLLLFEESINFLSILFLPARNLDPPFVDQSQDEIHVLQQQDEPQLASFSCQGAFSKEIFEEEKKEEETCL